MLFKVYIVHLHHYNDLCLPISKQRSLLSPFPAKKKRLLHWSTDLAAKLLRIDYCVQGLSLFIALRKVIHITGFLLTRLYHLDNAASGITLISSLIWVVIKPGVGHYTKGFILYLNHSAGVLGNLLWFLFLPVGRLNVKLSKKTISFSLFNWQRAYWKV